MCFADLLFILFSCFLILSSGMVVFSRHPVFSLLFLVGSFLASSFLLLILECELLALLFLTVYVGAIAILFLFAVMMLDFKHYSLQKNVILYAPVGIFFGSIPLLFLIKEINTFFLTVPYNNFYIDGYINWYDLIDSKTDVDAMGNVLYSYFVLHFLLAGIILLVVLFGVVHLTNVTDIKLHNKNKTQKLYKQLSRNFKTF